MVNGSVRMITMSQHCALICHEQSYRTQNIVPSSISIAELHMSSRTINAPKLVNIIAMVVVVVVVVVTEELFKPVAFLIQSN